MRSLHSLGIMVLPKTEPYIYTYINIKLDVVHVCKKICLAVTLC